MLGWFVGDCVEVKEIFWKDAVLEAGFMVKRWEFRCQKEGAGEIWLLMILVGVFGEVEYPFKRSSKVKSKMFDQL